MATQVLQFNQAQQAVLNVISCLQSEQDLADLKRTLVKFMPNWNNNYANPFDNQIDGAYHL